MTNPQEVANIILISGEMKKEARMSTLEFVSNPVAAIPDATIMNATWSKLK
jgi:hypothetical protein